MAFLAYYPFILPTLRSIRGRSRSGFEIVRAISSRSRPQMASSRPPVNGLRVSSFFAAATRLSSDIGGDSDALRTPLPALRLRLPVPDERERDFPSLISSIKPSICWHGLRFFTQTGSIRLVTTTELTECTAVCKLRISPQPRQHLAHARKPLFLGIRPRCSLTESAAARPHFH